MKIGPEPARQTLQFDNAFLLLARLVQLPLSRMTIKTDQRAPRVDLRMKLLEHGLRRLLLPFFLVRTHNRHFVFANAHVELMLLMF